MADDLRVPSMQEVDDLVDQIKLLLQGKGPMMQGAALADIVSMFFAGHHPQIREEQIENWVETMRKMIEVNEAQLLEHYGMPPGWRETN